MILNVVNAFSLLYPLGKECGLSLKEIWFSLILESFVPSLFEINWPSGSGENFLNVVNVFFSLENGMAFQLKKPEFPFSKGYSTKTYEVPSEGTLKLRQPPIEAEIWFKQPPIEVF